MEGRMVPCTLPSEEWDLQICICGRFVQPLLVPIQREQHKVRLEPFPTAWNQSMQLSKEEQPFTDAEFRVLKSPVVSPYSLVCQRLSISYAKQE